MLAFDGLREVEGFVRLIGKGIAECRLVDAEVWRKLRRVIKPNGGFEVQFLGRLRKIDHRNAVSENVVNLSNLLGLRNDDEGVVEKPLIEAVAWPEHQPVFAKPYRSLYW